MNAFQTVATIFASLVAFIHVYIFVLETFLWRARAGKVFRMKKEVVHLTSSMAANQGLYNGFLAAGLIWGIGRQEVHVTCFFLGCVVIAGVFGALTASIRIIYVQTVPATIAFVLAQFAYKSSGQELGSGDSNVNPLIDIGLLFVVSLITAAVGFFIQVREERAKAAVAVSSINEPLNRSTEKDNSKTQ